MNQTMVKSSRNSLKNDRGQKQGRPADSNLNKADGEFEELYRFLEERYGYSRETAKEELHRRIRR